MQTTPSDLIRQALGYETIDLIGGSYGTRLAQEVMRTNPEPLRAVKWMIEEHINDSNLDSPSPWLSWGPYLWADGLTPRSDGLIWEPSDFEPDGVHTSSQGALKVATKLCEFFENDSAAQPWFFCQSR